MIQHMSTRSKKGAYLIVTASDDRYIHVPEWIQGHDWYTLYKQPTTRRSQIITINKNYIKFDTDCVCRIPYTLASILRCDFDGDYIAICPTKTPINETVPVINICDSKLCGNVKRRFTEEVTKDSWNTYSKDAIFRLYLHKELPKLPGYFMKLSGTIETYDDCMSLASSVKHPDVNISKIVSKLIKITNNEKQVMDIFQRIIERVRKETNCIYQDKSI